MTFGFSWAKRKRPEGFAAPFTNTNAPALSRGDKLSAAVRLGVSPKHIDMLLKVESGGKSFDSRGRPVILFEPHVFHRRTNGKWSPSSFSYRKRGERPYPRGYDARWAQMEEAAKRDTAATLESASWGLFQVMGFHWAALGYDSVESFARSMAQSEWAQLDAMVRYIEAFDLKDKLRACRAGDPDSCRAFAAGYNGGGYEKNRYHEKMARALR